MSNPAPFQLTAAASASRGTGGGWGTWFLHSFAGRLLILLLALDLLERFGAPLPDIVTVPKDIALFFFVVWGVLRLGGAIARLLFWRIRTRLIVSYLFVGVVPVVLLLLLVALTGILFLSLVAAHNVTTAVHHTTGLLRTTAAAALPELPGDNAATARALEQRLAPARALHPEVAWTLVRNGRIAVKVGNAPAELPAWIGAPGFGGLVRDADAEFIRAVARHGTSHLVVQVPVDGRLFEELERTMTIRLLTSGGSLRTTGGGITVNIEDGEARRLDDERRTIDGMAFVAPTERHDWATGETSLDPLTFSFDPVELIQRLSPGTARVAELLVQVLSVVAGVFLVMYAVALLIGLLLARSVTKSVHALSRGTERLRRGDFTTAIPVYGRDQLGELAESFNLMAGGIQQLLVEQAEKERLAEELRIARQIQMKLLPQGEVSLPGLRIAALCLPAAEVGGDYYDLLPLSPTRMGVLVADVSGKGTSAALYMAELKGLVLSLSRIYDSPARLLVEANRILAGTMDTRSFITMTYAVVDTETRTLRYARAGHNPLIHLDARTGSTRILAPAGLGLGIDRHGRFEEILEESVVPMSEGDVFLLFTDGLSEAMNPESELFGEHRLRDLIHRSEAMGSEEIKEAIVAELNSFVGSAAQHDDMTMVVLKVVAETTPLELPLPEAALAGVGPSA